MPHGLLTDARSLVCPSWTPNRYSPTFVGVGIELDDVSLTDARTYYMPRPVTRVYTAADLENSRVRLTNYAELTILTEQLYLTLGKGYPLAHEVGLNKTFGDGHSEWHRASASFFADLSVNFIPDNNMVRAWDELDGN